MFYYVGQALNENNYVNFSGRTSRKPFWAYIFFNFIAMIYVQCVIALCNQALRPGVVPTFAYGIVILGVLFICFYLVLPGIAVSIRRLHDSNKSGWFFLLFCIPVLGFIFMLIFGLMPSTKGENRFGPEPKDRKSDRVKANNS